MQLTRRMIVIPLIVLLLLHHRYIHRDDLTGVAQWFQIEDIMNHETWIVAGFAFLL